MESLDGVLEELASQLGVSVGQLWDWLQGYGIKAYASARIAQLAPVAAFGILLFAAMVAMPLVSYKRLEDVYDDEFAVLTCVIVEFVLLIASIVPLICMCELLGWVVSPEGMVMQKLLEVL